MIPGPQSIEEYEQSHKTPNQLWHDFRTRKLTMITDDGKLMTWDCESATWVET